MASTIPRSEAPALFRFRLHPFAVHPYFIDGVELWHCRGIDPLCRVAKQFTADDASSGIGWFHRVVVLVRQVLFQPSCLTMTTAEKVELGLIPVLGVSVWMVAPEESRRMDVGTLLLWASASLLFQSLVRDLWLLRKAKLADQTNPVRKMRCMCVESTIGVSGVIFGGVLLGTGLHHSILMHRWTWTLLTATTMAGGFIVKDYVFEWNPLRIRRDKDHMSIVFTWKA